MSSTPVPDALLALRRALHQFPELSGAEWETRQRIRQFLEEHAGALRIREIAQTGLLCSIAAAKPGPAVLFRADTDALPIADQSGASDASRREGLGHQCGHDGHTAMLCGLALYLNQHPPRRGTAYLLFQPAEETGQGALQVLSDLDREGLAMDFAYAIHNLPGLPLGQVICRTGRSTPSVVSLALDLLGQTAHAAEPWKGRNPSGALAELLLWARGREVQDPLSPDFALLTPVGLQMGGAFYGTSAGSASLHFTLRADTDASRDAQLQALLQQAGALAGRDGLKLEHRSLQPFAACHNHPQAAEAVHAAAQRAGLEAGPGEAPFPWGEDFGFIAARYPSALIGLGAGDLPPLHHPRYHFPDGLLAPGIALWSQLAAHHLASDV
jgi:amidohydrolase